MRSIRGSVSQSEAAQLSGLTQSKISRAESGRFPLSETEAESFAHGLSASAAQRRALVRLAAAHRAENIVGRRQLVTSAHVLQRRIADLQRSTRSLRAWVPDLVPGILQTEPYTRAVLGFDPDERWWAGRRQQQSVLTDPGHTVHLIMSEAALRWGLDSPGVMRQQIEHVIDLAGRPPLRLGVVPLDRIHPIAPPRGFYVYGESTASVATDVGTTFVRDPEVRDFVEQHRALQRIACYDDDATKLLRMLAGPSPR